MFLPLVSMRWNLLPFIHREQFDILEGTWSYTTDYCFTQSAFPRSQHRTAIESPFKDTAQGFLTAGGSIGSGLPFLAAFHLLETQDLTLGEISLQRVETSS